MRASDKERKAAYLRLYARITNLRNVAEDLDGCSYKEEYDKDIEALKRLYKEQDHD